MAQRLLFDWDPAKAAANLAKHGVSFEQAYWSLPIRSLLPCLTDLGLQTRNAGSPLGWREAEV